MVIVLAHFLTPVVTPFLSALGALSACCGSISHILAVSCPGPVLSCPGPVLSCPALSCFCPVLSCPVLCCPVLCCSVLSCSGPVLFLSCPVLCCLGPIRRLCPGLSRYVIMSSLSVSRGVRAVNAPTSPHAYRHPPARMPRHGGGGGERTAGRTAASGMPRAGGVPGVWCRAVCSEYWDRGSGVLVSAESWG